jgi:hypothetical protein
VESRVPAGLKSEIEQAIAAVKDAMKGEDVQRIRQATERLTQTSMRLAEVVNRATAETNAAAGSQLIRDLGKLGVNDDGVLVILDLVDQLHGLRRMLRDLLSTIDAQPEAARRQILSSIGDARSEQHG